MWMYVMQFPSHSLVVWLITGAVAILASVWFWLNMDNRRWHKERKAIANVEKHGGVVHFDTPSLLSMSDLTALLARRRPVRRACQIHFAGCCDDRTLQEVTAADKLRVQFVEVADCQISDAGLAALCQLHHMKHIELRGSQLTDSCVTSLSGSAGVIGLVVEGPQFGDAAIHAIAANLHVAQLEGLSLAGGAMSDSGLSALRRLSGLSYLHIACPHVSDSALPLLKELRKLRVIWLYGTGVSQEAADELAAALPQCEVNWDDCAGERQTPAGLRDQ